MAKLYESIIELLILLLGKGMDIQNLVLSEQPEILELCSFLISFTGPTDEWTTDRSYNAVDQFTRSVFNQSQIQNKIISFLLSQIKTGFSKDRSSTVTEAGRKMIYQPHVSVMYSSMISADQPNWQLSPELLTKLDWCILNLNVSVFLLMLL